MNNVETVLPNPFQQLSVAPPPSQTMRRSLPGHWFAVLAATVDECDSSPERKDESRYQFATSLRMGRFSPRSKEQSCADNHGTASEWPVKSGRLVHDSIQSSRCDVDGHVAQTHNCHRVGPVNDHAWGGGSPAGVEPCQRDLIAELKALAAPYPQLSPRNLDDLMFDLEVGLGDIIEDIVAARKRRDIVDDTVAERMPYFIRDPSPAYLKAIMGAA